MKDVLGAFGSEVFRPLVTLLLPGALALSSWITAGIWANHTIYTLVNQYRMEAWIVGVLLMLFIGLVCEDIGSHLEDHFDTWRDGKDKKYTEEWHAYWRVAYDHEPIGHRYLRTVLLRLKFELGSLVGCGFAFLGIWWLPISCEARLIVSAFTVVAAGFFFFESWESHELLGKIRAELLKP